MEPPPDASPIPDPLRRRPQTEQEIDRWVDPAEPSPSAFWSGDDSWRETTAFYRWLGARRAWAAEHGLSYVDTFHPRDPATGRRSWS